MATAMKQPSLGTHPHEWLSAARLAPLTGVAAMLAGLGGLVVLEGPGARPEWDAPQRLFLEYFSDRGSVVFGSFLFMLSGILFIWFAGALRAVLHEAEGEGGRLSTVAFGGGLGAAVCVMALAGANTAGATLAPELSRGAAKTFFLFGDAFLYPAAASAAVLLLAAGLVMLRTHVLPRLLAWTSLLVALWLVIPPLGSSGSGPENPAAWTGLAAFAVALPLWTIVTAVVLTLRRPSS
jgi:hypothetical protein